MRLSILRLLVLFPAVAVGVGFFDRSVLSDTTQDAGTDKPQENFRKRPEVADLFHNHWIAGKAATHGPDHDSFLPGCGISERPSRFLEMKFLLQSDGICFVLQSNGIPFHLVQFCRNDNSYRNALDLYHLKKASHQIKVRIDHVDPFSCISSQSRPARTSSSRNRAP